MEPRDCLRWLHGFFTWHERKDRASAPYFLISGVEFIFLPMGRIMNNVIGYSLK